MSQFIELLDAHGVALVDQDEADIWGRIEEGLGGYHAYDVADLAIRTCRCGVRIDGFDEYLAHLKAAVSA